MNIRYVETTVTDSGVTVLKLLPDQLREAELCYAVRDQMVTSLEPTGANHVIIDMENVNFVGSIGLLAFLAVRRKVSQGRIVICNLDESIREMFVVCQLLSEKGGNRLPFEASNTLEEALNALAD